jgi:hypothetical protein
LPTPAAGETLYLGEAVFANSPVKGFKVAFLLSADHDTIHSLKVVYHELKFKGTTAINVAHSWGKRYNVGNDISEKNISNQHEIMRLTGLTFVRDGATAKVWYKYIENSIGAYNPNPEVLDFGTADIRFKILEGRGPGIGGSSRTKQTSNGTFEILGFEGNKASFRAVVETPVYSASASSGERSVKASSIKNTKGDMHIGNGATVAPGSSLPLNSSSNIRLPQGTEVECTFDNLPTGFTPKTLVLLTGEKAAPMSYNLVSGEWIKPKQMNISQTSSAGSPQNTEQDIVELIENNIIEAEVTGKDITMVNLRIRRLVPETVNVHIPAGSFFVSENPAAQNMVATAEKKTRLTTDSWTNITIPAACANRPKDIPDSNDKFSIQRSPNQEELAKLAPILAKSGAGTLIKQAAVWIVTDDADFEDLGILTNSDNTRAIWYETATRAMKACAEAGIDITKKRIWNDRETIISKLSAGDLKKWLQDYVKTASSAIVETGQKQSSGTVFQMIKVAVPDSVIFTMVEGKVASYIDVSLVAGGQIVQGKTYGSGTLTYNNGKMFISSETIAKAKDFKAPAGFKTEKIKFESDNEIWYYNVANKT